MSDDVEEAEFLRAGDTIVLEADPCDVLAVKHESSPLDRSFVPAHLEEKTMRREGELVEARAFEGRPLPHTVRRRSPRAVP